MVRSIAHRPNKTVGAAGSPSAADSITARPSERVGGKAPTLALAVADHEATLIHRSPEQRGGLRRRRQTDETRREAGAILLQRRRAWPGRSILTTSGRITKLRLVRSGSLLSNDILGISPGRTQIGSSREDWFMKIEIEYCGQ